VWYEAETFLGGRVEGRGKIEGTKNSLKRKIGYLGFVLLLWGYKMDTMLSGYVGSALMKIYRVWAFMYWNFWEDEKQKKKMKK